MVTGGILDDIIEDTDIFLVLARRPAMPELVVAESFIFRIESDGGVTCAVRSEEP
jgi:hypothetical protein